MKLGKCSSRNIIKPVQDKGYAVNDLNYKIKRGGSITEDHRWGYLESNLENNENSLGELDPHGEKFQAYQKKKKNDAKGLGRTAQQWIV